MESHLLQMRGLKHKICIKYILDGWVASFTDAWIETPKQPVNSSTKCRIFYRCVD